MFMLKRSIPFHCKMEWRKVAVMRLTNVELVINVLVDKLFVLIIESPPVGSL